MCMCVYVCVQVCTCVLECMRTCTRRQYNVSVLTFGSLCIILYSHVIHRDACILPYWMLWGQVAMVGAGDLLRSGNSRTRFEVVDSLLVSLTSKRNISNRP